MSRFAADLRFALRTLRRGPLFTLVAILSLALGIGANTAIFTLMDQLMLRQVAVKEPDSLVMLFQRGAHNGNNMGDRMQSYPIYRDYQEKAAPLAEVICRRLVPISVSIDNQTERLDAELVSGNFFTMLGVKAEIGRVFTPELDDRVYQGHPNVVLSHAYWMARFSGDRSVVGRKILVNSYPMTIAGVSAAGFAGIDPARSPQIRVPVLMSKAVLPEWSFLNMEDRRSRWVQVFARLKPGYTVESAQAPMQVLFRQIREHEMTLPAARNWTAYSREQFLRGTLHVERAATGYSQMRNSFSAALIVLMCMVGLVLLIACANVANLLIARAFARRKEIAVRLSMGATRGQLIRQLLVESFLLSAAGGMAGILIAIGLGRALLALVPAEGNPLLIRAEPDPRILAFTLCLTFLTGLMFGLVPALRASRPDLWPTLKDAAGSLSGSSGSLFLRKSLVTAQVALSFLLLFGAGLFVRSLQNLMTAATGFRDLGSLVTFQIAPALSGYDASRTVQFYRDLRERILAVPGIKSTALASVPLLRGWEWDSSVTVEGHQAKDGEDMQAYMNAVTPGYFQTMGIALLEGRDFTDADIKRDSKAIIVNRSFAEHYFPGRSAVGRHVGRGNGPGTVLDLEIAGVAADSLYEGPREGIRRQIFVPNWGRGSATFYVRSGLDPNSAYAAMRGAVRGLDASMPVYEMKTLKGQLDQTLLTERLVALLAAGFGLVATVLAAIGLYGVMAFAVARRRQEIGIRVALGASPGSVIWLVMREVLLLLGIGLSIGLPAAAALGQFTGAQLYGVKAHDPAIAVGTVLLLAAVSGAAGLIPVARASRIAPIIALRYE